MSVANDIMEEDLEDLTEEDVDDELNLPKSLSEITYQEKIELFRYKKQHTEREWEEEISRRAAAFERKLDYERLKRMTGGRASTASFKKVTNHKNFKPEPEEGEIAGGSEKVDITTDHQNDYKTSQISSEEEDDDDDLFDSDEEAEISKRPTKHFIDEVEEGDGRKKPNNSKILGKRKSSLIASKGKLKSGRHSNASSSFDESEEDDVESDGISAEQDFDFTEHDREHHDYNLKSIKDSHRRGMNRDGLPPNSSAGSGQLDKTAVMFDNLTQLKNHLEKQLQKELPFKPDDNDLVEHDDFRKLFRRRDDIIQNLHEPFFDQLMIGCYVRYLIGVVDSSQVYRMCEIIGIDRSKRPYKLPPVANGLVTETNVRLVLNNAGEIRQYQKLDKVSNHSLLDKEIEFHIEGMKSHPEKVLPTKRDFRKLRQRHKQYAEHTYTHEDISHMVSSKLGLNKFVTTEYSTAMNLLKRRLDDALLKNDKDKIETLRKEIRRLDEITEKQKELFEANAKKQSDINRRMRESNVTRDMDAGMRKRHEEQEAVSKGILPNAISDPFIRRETRPKILWNTSENLRKRKQENESNETQKQEGSATSVAVREESSGRKYRGGTEEDRWSFSTLSSFHEVRKRVKQRLGVDPYGELDSKRQKYLRRVCGGLPPLGSAEREALRGQNKSLKDYILLLSRNGEAMEDR